MLTKGDITLRPLLEEDKKPLAALANNKKLFDNLRDAIPFPYSEKDAEDFIGLMKDQNPVMVFAITYKNEFCGTIGLLPQQDVYRNNAEIGYWLGEPFWGKGIVTTAAGLITDYGFNQLNYTRLFTGVFAFNAASMRVLEKNGYKKEGIFEKAIIKNGQTCDEHRYAKLKQ